MKLYKLTSQSKMTKHGMRWGENAVHTAYGDGIGLCSSAVIHAYTDPVIAVLVNPIHADFPQPLLWEAEGEIVNRDALKVGVKTLQTIKQIPLPKISREQLIEIAIRVAILSRPSSDFLVWANAYLTGTREADRPFTTYGTTECYAVDASISEYAGYSVACLIDAAVPHHLSLEQVSEIAKKVIGENS